MSIHIDWKIHKENGIDVVDNNISYHKSDLSIKSDSRTNEWMNATLNEPMISF